MDLYEGYFYFIKDSFFEKVNDPYLMRNYPNTKRPHYLPYIDSKTGLYWMIPCSSKVSKYQAIVNDKIQHHKPHDTIQFINIAGRASVLLFQDMFPVSKDYIENQYVNKNGPIFIKNQKIVISLNKIAKSTISSIRRGVTFSITQPDSLKIEKMLIEGQL
ncbi:MAG: hypothetical protein LUB56_03270 [Coprobacillus sp.]|nr:hypothetical protein [Coprobacillus sp.]